MSSLLYTSQNLADEVRSLLDEENVDSVDTERDILPSLNRGLVFAFDILARKYPEPILTYGTLSLTGGAPEYDIPEDTFEDRILKAEISVPSGAGGGTFREIERISYRDISNYESASRTNIPYYYCVVGRKLRFVPAPTGTYSARLWRLRNPEKLVLPQGRITHLNPTANYCIVDAIGGDLSTSSDELQSYVNVIDGQTGEIKKTLQIGSIDENKVTFRSSPSRSTVLNRDIDGSFTTDDITEDDYLCLIQGICVPYYGQPTCNFLVQYTVAEITRKLGGSADTEEKILQKFEQQVERTWVGREKQTRVQKKSQVWGQPTRRWYFE